MISNIKILFVSATPKNYGNKYDSIFGKVKYTLEWKYAIDNKYICDYKFYYPNNDKIIEYIKNIKFDTSIIEKTILINKAFFLLESIKSLNIKKCIVYLKTIKEADLFENILKTINIYFSMSLGVYNINYNTSRTKRNISLTKFKNNKTKICIMLNVHILDEGIDIPACDAVYLTHPNNNPVNIIQRISRANRISENKTIANVLLWSKNELKLENIIKLLETYIPVKFNNINNEFINNRILNNDNDINNNITSNCNKKAFTNIILKFFKDNNIEILILTDNNNKLWFSISQILKILDYKNIKKEKTRIITDNKYFSTYTNIMNLSSNNVKISKIQPHTKMINEEGLYLLLNKSTKSFAKNIIEKFYTET